MQWQCESVSFVVLVASEAAVCGCLSVCLSLWESCVSRCVWARWLSAEALPIQSHGGIRAGMKGGVEIEEGKKGRQIVERDLMLYKIRAILSVLILFSQNIAKFVCSALDSHYIYMNSSVKPHL